MKSAWKPITSPASSGLRRRGVSGSSDGARVIGSGTTWRRRIGTLRRHSIIAVLCRRRVVITFPKSKGPRFPEAQ